MFRTSIQQPETLAVSPGPNQDRGRSLLPSPQALRAFWGILPRPHGAPPPAPRRAAPRPLGGLFAAGSGLLAPARRPSAGGDPYTPLPGGLSAGGDPYTPLLGGLRPAGTPAPRCWAAYGRRGPLRPALRLQLNPGTIPTHDFPNPRRLLTQLLQSSTSPPSCNLGVATWAPPLRGPSQHRAAALVYSSDDPHSIQTIPFIPFPSGGLFPVRRPSFLSSPGGGPPSRQSPSGRTYGPSLTGSPPPAWALRALTCSARAAGQERDLQGERTPC